MAEIVGGFLVPHDPVMFVARDAAPADQAERVWGAFERCAERLAESGATTAVIVGNDHYMLFGTTCLPKYCIATGHVEGPLDQMPGLKKEPVPNNEPLATAIAEHGSVSGFDWAVARSFTTDHAFAIPYKLIVKRASELSGREIKAVPVYLASAVDPFITTRRARELGEQIRAAVLAFEGDDKVTFIGSGGISHWVGTKESGQVNEEFDRYIIDLCCSMNMAGLVALGDEEILTRGGNGAMEIRNFICAMAAVNAARGELVEYQPIPAWVTGLGLIELLV